MYLLFVIIDLSLRLGCMEIDSEMRRGYLTSGLQSASVRKWEKEDHLEGDTDPQCNWASVETLGSSGAGCPFRGTLCWSKGFFVPQSSSLTVGSPLRGSLTLSEVVLCGQGHFSVKDPTVNCQEMVFPTAERKMLYPWGRNLGGASSTSCTP